MDAAIFGRYIFLRRLDGNYGAEHDRAQRKTFRKTFSVSVVVSAGFAPKPKLVLFFES